MGALFSKYSNKQQEDSPEKTTPTKPILTPNSRLSECDPRSPSANICRTPIDLSGTPIQEEFGSIHDTFNLNSPVCYKVLSDPRSPAIEFTRTPIIAQEKKQIVLRNKNFDNVLLNNTPKQRKPKLLDSTPINSTSKNFSKRKSFAGYLETNLDFVETNLDEVVLRKSLSNLCTRSDYTRLESIVNRIDKEVHDCTDKGFNDSVDREDGLITNTHTNNKEHIADVQNIMDDIVDDVFKIEDINIDIIPRIVAISPKPRKIIKSFDKKIKDLIYQATELATDNDKHIISEDAIQKEENDIVQQDLEEDIVDTDVNDLVDKHVSAEKIDAAKDVELKNKDCLQGREIKTRKNSIISDIKNCENKVFNHTGIANIIKRVPLTDRNGSNKTRIIPKLRVHDKPRKSQYSVSKIPQFKGKRFSKGCHTQCENTPPPKNASVWDNEETLII